MSATDTVQEFKSDIDDWWCQTFALRIAAPAPNTKMRDRFIAFVDRRCSEAGTYKLDDKQLGILFSEFIEYLGEW